MRFIKIYLWCMKLKAHGNNVRNHEIQNSIKPHQNYVLDKILKMLNTQREMNGKSYCDR